MAGWIKLWEIPEDHWLRSDLRYIGAWNELIQMAEIKKRRIVKYGQMVEAERGAVYTSMSELAEKWNVSRWWVRHFLEMLESDGMIHRQQTDSRLSTIFISNYAKYQDKPNNRPTADRQDIVQQTDGSLYSRPTAEATSFLKNNTEGIDGTDGIEGVREQRRFTPPTLEEVLAYISDHRLAVDGRRFWNHYESVGWMVGRSGMKDWKAALRTWNTKDAKNQEPNPKKFDNFQGRSPGSGSAMDELLARLEGN